MKMRHLVVLLSAFTISQQAFSISILDTFSSGDSTYHLIAGNSDGSVGINWTNAETYAVSLGGHLATINNSAEQDLIWGRWGQSAVTPSWPPGNYASLWIGMRYTWTKETGWRHGWVSGESVTYTNWGPGEPKGNGLYTFMAGSLFAPVDENRGKWNDFHNEPFHSIPNQVLYGVVETNRVPDSVSSFAALGLVALGLLALRQHYH